MLCSLLRAEGFSCNLDVLYGGLGIRKFQFLNKRMSICLAVNVFQFFVINTLALDPDTYPDPHWPKCWIQIRIWIHTETNADPKHWRELFKNPYVKIFKYMQCLGRRLNTYDRQKSMIFYTGLEFEDIFVIIFDSVIAYKRLPIFSSIRAWK